MKSNRQVFVIELRRLLHDIRDRRSDVRVRMRLLGKMWCESFLSVDSFDDEGVVLFDSLQGKYLHIHRLADVIQFELECSFFGYHAHYHYDVINPSEVVVNE
jgi:hypothetical protein